ncbi:MAG: hypothetical protein ONB44_00835 [candidate division KSB1 bacterium]|nr:hypothetical protein [candidate division KSB1 bacterium]MDZ7300664.1 hypothetical protein [candidate division KSB1 bacterium]MDZ7309801.1 hypothetical protein [candidate division KSB1 bacterium]
MTTSEYAQKIVELIDTRPRRIDLDKLLYEIYVRAKIAESRRAQQEGRCSTHEQVMERMWKRIYSKFDGHNQQKKTSTKSSTRSPKTHR